jgi:Pyridoxamine 5''-phosphate oxidase.
MIINDDVKAVISAAGYLSLITIGADGMPHAIIAGSRKISNDTIVFGIYKMETTQKNLASDSSMCVLAAVISEKPMGYRLTGTAKVTEKEVIFTPSTAESLI